MKKVSYLITLITLISSCKSFDEANCITYPMIESYNNILEQHLNELKSFLEHDKSMDPINKKTVLNIIENFRDQIKTNKIYFDHLIEYPHTVEKLMPTP